MADAQIIEDGATLMINSSTHQKILMAEVQIVEGVDASPLSEAPKFVGLNAPLQLQLETLWGNENEAEKFTIFHTPHSISQSKKYLFEPSVISIGPFHRSQKNLRVLEEQKRRFLRDFLSRNSEINLNLCISEMKLLETRTRLCYNETFDDLDSDTFVEMMLLDGCFVLEYVNRAEPNWNEVGWDSYFIKRDLLLLENQIPFFIVDKLYELIGYNIDYKNLFVKNIAGYLFPKNYILPAPPAETPDSTHTTDSTDSDHLPEMLDPPDEIHHLVHLCYHYLVPNSPEIQAVSSSKSFDLTSMLCANRILKGLLHQFRSRVLIRGRSPHSISGSSSVALPTSTRNISSIVIPSATELKQKGLKFRPKSNPKHMLDISFEYGVLKIPTLQITDTTKPIFANLIAFEHSKYGQKEKPFTSFIHFLDNLVNTPNDVTILQECGIIENCLSSEEECTNFINQITEGGFISRVHYLTKLNMEVNRYVGSSWHRNRARLICDYFSTPWATISLIAAFILLVLTLVQSFFAVFAYFRPPSS